MSTEEIVNKILSVLRVQERVVAMVTEDRSVDMNFVLNLQPLDKPGYTWRISKKRPQPVLEALITG